jgi:MYXO-CTERM domain-containing protein
VSKRLLPVVAFIALGWMSAGCGDERAAPLDSSAVIEQGLRQALATADEVDVIVSFREPADATRATERGGRRRALAAMRESVLATVQRGFTPTRRYEHVPAVAGRVSLLALDALARDPNVRYVQFDSAGKGALTVSVPAIGADAAQAHYGVSGRGIRVAVLDTGIASNHPDLASSVVTTQHCFTRGDCPPNGATEGTSAEDDHGHGSHVSGIITSDGKVAGRGFAPDAEIVAVKINDDQSSGMVSDWVAGLDWVFDNLATLDVQIVNLSICTDQLFSSQSECDNRQPALAAAITNLIEAGVTVFAASGNKGSSSQVSAPACNSGVIAVGATYKSDQGRQPGNGTYSSHWGSTFDDCADDTTAFDRVACFTNSGSRLDLLAPGAAIVSDSLAGGTEIYRGTSQAAPTAAGVAALMLECDASLVPAAIKDILVRTGVSVEDPKSGLSYPSIRAEAAVREACSGALGTGGTPGTGGAAAAGGLEATGGSLATGGVEAAGTSFASGGAEVAGGSLGTGGIEPTGGMPSSGGETPTGGASSPGGVVATGGASAAGGVVATGGSVATGGLSGPGGGGATGGRAGTGGTPDAGRSGAVAAAPTGGAPDGSGGRAASAGSWAMAGSAAPQQSAARGSGCVCSAAGATRSGGSFSWALLAFTVIAVGSRRRRAPQRPQSIPPAVRPLTPPRRSPWPVSGTPPPRCRRSSGRVWRTRREPIRTGCRRIERRRSPGKRRRVQPNR